MSSILWILVIGAKVVFDSVLPMRSRRPSLFALGLALALAGALDLAPARARARGGLALEWRAPDECPTAQTVQSMVAEFLGADPRRARELSATASVERDAQDVYWLLLRIDGAGQHTERSLSDPNCATLARASALLIAIAIDPEVEARVAEQPIAPPPAPPAVPTPAPPKPAPPKPAPPKPAPTEPTNESGGSLELRPGAELGGVFDAGTLHAAGFGFDGAFTLRLDVLRLALGAQWLLPRTVDIPATPDSGSARLNAATTVTRACVAWNVSRFDLGPCAVLELGLIWGDTRNIHDPSSGHALWLSYGGGVQARWHFMRDWSLFAGGAVLAPHVRRRFYVNTEGGQFSVHQVPPATGRVGLGIAFEVE
jgi:hypothetical protein